jgi:hypothetical protein
MLISISKERKLATRLKGCSLSSEIDCLQVTTRRPLMPVESNTSPAPPRDYRRPLPTPCRHGPCGATTPWPPSKALPGLRFSVLAQTSLQHAHIGGRFPSPNSRTQLAWRAWPVNVCPQESLLGFAKKNAHDDHY